MRLLRPYFPRPSVRLRLTFTYCTLFVVASVALLGLNYFLVDHREHKSGTAVQILCKGPDGSFSGAIAGTVRTQGPLPGPGVIPPGVDCSTAVGTVGNFTYNVNGSGSGGVTQTARVSPAQRQLLSGFKQTISASQAHTLDSLLLESGIALALMTLVSIGLGWWIAGRVLRPIHRITDAARRLSEQTLHARINLEGPNDELKDLADTFDAMLGRLDRAFQSQRRFVANASHELRTPLATERVLIDEALINRSAGPEELRAILEKLRINSEDTERLIDALLVLARSERGVETWSPIDIKALAVQVVEHASAEARVSDVELRTDLKPASAAGDPGLIERLVGNLVENAIRHNQPGGWVKISTSASGGRSVLTVANSGPVIDAAVVQGLTEPFRRSGPERACGDGGFGLGLSIVDAIVTGHHGELCVAARPEGGLEVRVTLRGKEISEGTALAEVVHPRPQSTLGRAGSPMTG